MSKLDDLADNKYEDAFWWGQNLPFCPNEHLKIQNLAKSCKAKGEAGEKTKKIKGYQGAEGAEKIYILITPAANL